MAINKVNQGQTQDIASARLNQARQAEGQDKSQATNQPQSATKMAQDAVSITPKAAGLDKMQKSMSSEAPFDKDKVESLKKAIEAGEYKVNVDKLADKLLQFEEDLFGN
ncbi:flagellar biosynthesis anti-sigma factor FlgM [Gallaecimonas xiamenensis]|uniref:Negative regulator of flagellin synthesis n=1 Tax=Gallaecimonas xiamenensis 3-C-1 TaxID=745411 RepID=K2JYP6_9GAMM|nr:flagellar biosynthesis anti-sigma factor FlgM [Gallaecimonas xiamenensis]EKE75459.1 anti-sigma-28 factor FlgM family protein [Gallaecimonas xiamenensis 3-C-1]